MSEEDESQESVVSVASSFTAAIQASLLDSQILEAFTEKREEEEKEKE